MGGIIIIFQILGSICFFMYGMKIMSDGIQKVAGPTLRGTLRSVTKNRVFGFLTGLITTGVVQSSSATTVLTVSFVNAGLITTIESVGIIMGANVGTTITAWIVSILGFKIKLHWLSIPLFVLGLPLFLNKSAKYKYLGEFIIGFALIFLGLNFLQESFPVSAQDNGIIQWIKEIYKGNVFSYFVMFLAGLALTIVLQSSSAAIILTMTLVLKGWIPIEMGAAMILGENIGTTITAEISAIVANYKAKISARIHTIFNVLGVIIFGISLPIMIKITAWITSLIFGIENPLNDIDSAPFLLATFHTFFNVVTTLILIGFPHFLKKLASLTLRSNEEKLIKNDISSLSVLGNSPELITEELKKESLKFGLLARKMNTKFKELINSFAEEEQYALIKRIKDLEDETDEKEVEIVSYITKLTMSENTPRTSIRLRSIIGICQKLEEIGDLYQLNANEVKRKVKKKIWFSPDQRGNLNYVIDQTESAFELMLKNLANPHYSKVDKSESKETRNQIMKKISKLRKNVLENVDEKEENVQSMIIYNAMLASMDKINSYIYDISKNITGEI